MYYYVKFKIYLKNIIMYLLHIILQIFVKYYISFLKLFSITITYCNVTLNIFLRNIYKILYKILHNCKILYFRIKKQQYSDISKGNVILLSMINILTELFFIVIFYKHIITIMEYCITIFCCNINNIN